LTPLPLPANQNQTGGAVCLRYVQGAFDMAQHLLFPSVITIVAEGALWPKEIYGLMYV